MLDEGISNKVLFVGFDYKKPKGGIGSVLNTYSTFIKPYKFVRTSGGDLNIIQKIAYAISGCYHLVKELLDDKDIKIVHIHVASGVSFWRKVPFIVISKQFDKKVIFHCHGGGFREFRNKHKKLVDKYIRKCDEIVALSDVWKDYFESIYAIKTVVIRNVISEPRYLDIAKDSRVHLLFLGLICKNKGVYDMLEALRLCKNEMNGKICLHIGGNGETDLLKSLIEEYQLQSIVEFEGWVYKDKRERLLNLCDIFILPSYIEGVPISILEAESYKMPVITTNVGGVSSIVKDGENGVFVNPGDVNGIINAIKFLADNPNRRMEMGEQGYEMSKKYLPEIITDQLTFLYEGLLHC